jgi:hypothetical protein
LVARSTIACEVGDVRAVGHRDATGFSDFPDHGFRRCQRAARPVARAAEIIDHHLGAAARQRMRMRASKAVARASHNGDASIKSECHGLFPNLFSVMPGLVPGIHVFLVAAPNRRGLPGQVLQDALRALARQ